jgi:hypothetical protein
MHYHLFFENRSDDQIEVDKDKSFFISFLTQIY